MRETISHAEIANYKRDFILKNTLLTPVKVAELLSCSVKKVYRLVESADLTEANDTPGRQGMRITAWSVEQYRLMCEDLAAQKRESR
jgi:hypothetical protein